jgi:lipid II:glycine glycyltransferase (peptidoglycan interpeptide bridge formation enzyme)
MFNYTCKEAVEALECSKNINAALKKFLKQEIQNNDGSEKFVKLLKKALADGKSDRAERILENHLPEFEDYLFLMADFALPEITTQIAEQVVTKFAEQFNQSYEISDKTVTIKDQSTFERIAKEAVQEIDAQLSKEDIPGPAFMKNVLIYRIFDDVVIKEIAPVVGME